jgi:putative oxidoreductase
MLEVLRNLGVVLLGGVFVWAGAEHFLKFGETSDRLKQRRFPYPVPLLAAGSVLELVAGICLIVGFARFYAALALAAFTIAATVMLLDFWKFDDPERQAMRTAFLINIAVLGGLLIAATT